jgi:DNA-binding transcriptional LysR family regulator
LHRGHTDAEIGSHEPETTDLRSEHLGPDELRVVMSQGNSLRQRNLAHDHRTPASPHACHPLGSSSAGTAAYETNLLTPGCVDK